MAFVVKLLFLSALVYSTNGGYLSGQQNSDSFLSSALNAPSANFGPPSRSYGLPNGGSGGSISIQESVVEDHGPVTAGASLPGVGSIAASAITGGSLTDSHISHGYESGPAQISSGSFSGPESIASGPGPLSTDLSAPAQLGNGYSEGSLLLDSTLPGAPTGTAQIIGQTTQIGAPRVIGTSVSVGRPDASATRYELASVIQNIIRRIPIEVTRHIQLAVPQPVPVPVRQEVKVPVPQPYPVHVDVVKHVPYPVYKTEHVHVDRPVPYEVVKEVPFEVIRQVPVPVERPYEVIKKVHVPIEKHVEVPVAVWKPYPLHIIKHVTHYKKKSCCW